MKKGTGKLLAFAAMAAAASAHLTSDEIEDITPNPYRKKYGAVVRSNIGNAIQQAAKMKRRKAGKAAGQARKQSRK